MTQGFVTWKNLKPCKDDRQGADKVGKTQGRVGEITQHGKVLLHKSKDLSSNPHHPSKKISMVTCTCNPSTREVKTEGCLGLADCQPSRMARSRLGERPHLQNNVDSDRELTSGLYIHEHSCTNVCIHINILSKQ